VAIDNSRAVVIVPSRAEAAVVAIANPINNPRARSNPPCSPNPPAPMPTRAIREDQRELEEDEEAAEDAEGAVAEAAVPVLTKAAHKASPAKVTTNRAINRSSPQPPRLPRSPRPSRRCSAPVRLTAICCTTSPCSPSRFPGPGRTAIWTRFRTIWTRNSRRGDIFMPPYNASPPTFVYEVDWGFPGGGYVVRSESSSFYSC
jgi:hypothetical protein